MLHSVGGWSLKEPQGLFPKRRYCLQVKPTGIVSFVFLNLFFGQVMQACVIFSSLTNDQTHHTPCIGNAVLATGPPGKFHYCIIFLSLISVMVITWDWSAG